MNVGESTTTPTTTVQRTEEDNLNTIETLIKEKIDEKELSQLINDMRVDESGVSTFIKIDLDNVWVTEEALEDMFYGDPQTSVMKLIDDKIPEGFYPSYEMDEDAIYINIKTVYGKKGWDNWCILF